MNEELAAQQLKPLLSKLEAGQRLSASEQALIGQIAASKYAVEDQQLEAGSGGPKAKTVYHMRPVKLDHVPTPAKPGRQLLDGDSLTGHPKAPKFREAPHPFADKKCSARRCKAAVAWREVSSAEFTAWNAPEWECPPDSLSAQLESAAQRARMVGRQVPEAGTYYCEKHWLARQAERARVAEAGRAVAAVDPLSRPLHELDHKTARIDLGDDLAVFHVSDAAGNRIRLPMAQLKLAQIWARTGVVAW
jgi:hypothetical protein